MPACRPARRPIVLPAMVVHRPLDIQSGPQQRRHALITCARRSYCFGQALAAPQGNPNPVPQEAVEEGELPCPAAAEAAAPAAPTLAAAAAAEGPAAAAGSEPPAAAAPSLPAAAGAAEAHLGCLARVRWLLRRRGAGDAAEQAQAVLLAALLAQPQARPAGRLSQLAPLGDGLFVPAQSSAAPRARP